LFAYDLRSSKNFFNPNGFKKADGAVPWNVSYYDKKGVALDPTSDDYYQNIANLQYDPRPPVIYTEGKTNDFRYYLDLNRNGMFDWNGALEVTGPNNEHYATNGAFTTKRPFLTSVFSGDPEWIGVLERPDLPHSETNRFIGRYAYIMMPTGKSLDINYIHNIAVYPSAQPDLKYDGVSATTARYSRNQGVGSWELNLAAFLVDLHTNVWKPNLTAFYKLTTNESSGLAFRDAAGLLQYRLNNSRTNLVTPQEMFGTTNRWALDYVDMMADGPIVPYNFWYNSARPNFQLQQAGYVPDNDSDVRFWHGGEHMDRTAEFPDVQRYFRLNRPGSSTEQFDFFGKFTNAMSSTRTNTYDRYAYYRLLAQMGTESKPALQGKIHLNFATEPGSVPTKLNPWVTVTNNAGMPTLLARSNLTVALKQNDGGEKYVQQPNNLTNFFLMTANAMLRESLVTNVYLDEFNKWRTNYTIGCSYFHDPSLNTVPNGNTIRYIVGSPVRPDISITNIQIYHRPNIASAWRPNDLTYTNAEYTAAVHRVLQLAANVYDTMYNDQGRSAHAANDPYYPTVWRPLYDITPTNITITGWQPQVNAALALNHAVNTNLFRSPSEYFTNRNVIITNVSFYGQPWVVGVKKGWPTFNELSVETYAQVSRRLEISKNRDAKSLGKPVSLTDYANLANHTRQIYMLGLSNTVGLEAWNSYALTNNRKIRIDTRIETRVGIERVTARNPTNHTVITSVPVFASPKTYISTTNNYVVPKWPARPTQGQASNRTLTNAIPVDGGSDFRVPLYTLLPVLENSQYTEIPGPFGTFFANPAQFQSITNTPDFVISVTNRVRYLATDVDENRIIDYVSLDNIISKIDLDEAMRQGQNAGNILATGSNSGIVDPNIFWVPDPITKSQATSFGVNVGIMKQIEASLDILQLGADWKDYSAFARITAEIQKFQLFMYGTNNGAQNTNYTVQVPFTPSRKFYLISRYQANDPLVHFTAEDLYDPRQTTRPQIVKLTETAVNTELGKPNTLRQAIRLDHGIEFRDPRIDNSDDWQFPIAKLDDPNGPARRYGAPNFLYRFPNIGTLGQIHRGTPWQTVYLKAFAATNTPVAALQTPVPTWYQWAGSFGTHPTNDWKFVGLFTTAITENAARGLLSVNQTNTAAWSAVLSGVPVITNSLSNTKAAQNLPPQFGVPKGNNSGNNNNVTEDLLIQPGSVQLSNIVRSINQYRAAPDRPMGAFSYLGEVLGAPMLSFGINPDPNRQTYQGSPYLNFAKEQTQTPDGHPDWHEFTDEALEAIPQRILSLLKEDEPRVTIYCFGQTLKPAPRSFVTTADYYNLCVNYQVAGEYVTKAVVRVEGDFNNPQNPLRTVVESFEALAPFE
jgi:hypothetical protein